MPSESTGGGQSEMRAFGSEPRGCPTPGACSCPTGQADAELLDLRARLSRAEATLRRIEEIVCREDMGDATALYDVARIVQRAVGTGR